ncbi:MAG TPA: dienelactone hydrolase family protein [Kofleriaceae bacterium]|nr:dienelactone hydrolase family protein [Kofleriaceae bacterium]
MSWITIPVADGTTLDAWRVAPPAAPAPTVIVLHELLGLTAFIRDVAARLAGQGYLAIAPDLFHRTAPRLEATVAEQGMPHARQLTPPGVSADLEAVHAVLRGDPSADAARLAAWGFCMGGRIAHRANLVLPLRAAIAFYGSWPPADELPGLRAPTLLVWGGRDPHLPPEPRRALVDALAAAGKPYVDVVFGDVSHGFFADQAAPASRVAWQLVRGFLGEHLSARS